MALIGFTWELITGKNKPAKELKGRGTDLLKQAYSVSERQLLQILFTRQGLATTGPLPMNTTNLCRPKKH